MFGAIGVPTLLLRIIGLMLIIFAACACPALIEVSDSPDEKFIDVYAKFVSRVMFIVFVFAVLCFGLVLMVEPTMITG